jgi:hypothetical protein
MRDDSRNLPLALQVSGDHESKSSSMDKVSSTGVVIGTYEQAGELVTGSFA